MINRKIFPIPQCELELCTSDKIDTIVKKLSRYSTDKETAKNRRYNIPEYLFIMELTENGFILIPEQSNHYGKNNGAMPHLIGEFIEKNNTNIIKISARSDMLVPMYAFILICVLLCLIAGKYISGLIIFVISNIIIQIVFWMPCQKAISELEKIIGDK